MLGVEGVTQRIAQIHQQIASLSPPAARTSASGAFATTLAKAVSTEATPRSTTAGTERPTFVADSRPATTTRSATLKNGVPADLAAYGNGRIPADALSSIGVGKHRLWEPAAAAFTAMTAAARRDGVTIGVTDSYRSYDQQVDVARRKGLYSEGGLAAKPGTSDHGWGRSLDLDLNSSAQSWMRSNAGRFGFREDVPREPWHWTFKPR